MQDELQSNRFALQPIADSLKENNLLLAFNLYDEIRKRHDMEQLGYKSLYYPVDGHNNSKGYQLWAEILHTIIIRDSCLKE